jgi:lipopolysaccharide assembly outer membrane protein LptD (OstA)
MFALVSFSTHPTTWTMRFARLSALLLALPAFVLAQDPAKDKDKDSTLGLINALTSEINIDGLETSFDPVTGIATAKGEVHIVYGDTEIISDRADYNSNSGDVKAAGNVTVVKA